MLPPSLVRGWHLGLFNTLCHLPQKTTRKTDIMNRLDKYHAAVIPLLKYQSCLHEMKIQTAWISIFSICLLQNSDFVRGGLGKEYLSPQCWMNSPLSPRGITPYSYSLILNEPQRIAISSVHSAKNKIKNTFTMHFRIRLSLNIHAATPNAALDVDLWLLQH